MEQKSKALEFIYQDTQIHFLLGNEKNVMVNATEMAKAFGKRIENFKRLEETKVFIQALLRRENLKLAHSHLSEQNTKKWTESDLVQTTNKATYYHRKLALEFASWLDIDFKVWIIDTIDDLLFGDAKVAGEKISEVAIQEAKIKKLREDILLNGSEDAKKLLQEEASLVELKKNKNKAVNNFVKSNQPELDLKF